MEVDEDVDDFGGLQETEEVEEDLKRSAEEGEESSSSRRKVLVEVDRVIAVAQSRAAAEKEAAARINLSIEGSAAASAPARDVATA